VKPRAKQWLRLTAASVFVIGLALLAVAWESTEVMPLFPKKEHIDFRCNEFKETEFRVGHQLTCWTEPFTLGIWFVFEYSAGGVVPRSTSGYPTDSFTVWIPRDPGPLVRVVLVIGDHAIEKDIRIHAEYLGAAIAGKLSWVSTPIDNRGKP